MSERTGIIESLPSRPLARSEVESLGEHERISMISPIYGEDERDTAYGLVAVINERGLALAFTPSGEWVLSDSEPLDAEQVAEGIPWSEHETLERLQELVVRAINK